ncbi:barstar family protein [Amycolatopsis sp. NEAU-NG30]|uniref:Barstar family protein n=1 Tax=Amycolatopsis melonis TaxID=3156488 RepID=A0ABV0L963_9PSEU
MPEVDFVMFSLFDESSGLLILSAREIDGFFGVSAGRYPDVVFRGVTEFQSGRVKVEEATLHIIDRKRTKIGEYWVGRAISDRAMNSSSGPVLDSVVFRQFDGRCECRDAVAVWRRWASAELKSNEWAHWPASYHSAWLHVAQNSWFFGERLHVATEADRSVVYLAGKVVLTKASFFCALGEAVNGPGGYFGSNLDALVDCIRSNLGGASLSKIVWRDFDTSRQVLDADFLDSLIAVMDEFSIVLEFV